MTLQHIKLMAFDADDTLWDCQSHFDRVEQSFCQLLAEYGDAHTLSTALFETEKRNMPTLGYGTKAFTLSLIETAIAVSNGRVSARIIEEVMQMGRSLLTFPTTPLPGVEDTLIALNARADRKRSGLANYFDDCCVVADKTEAEYRHLCVERGIKPSQLLMIGNSFKSDIAPALAIGAHAVHVPFSVAWKMELSETFDHERLTTIENLNELL